MSELTRRDLINRAGRVAVAGGVLGAVAGVARVPVAVGAQGRTQIFLLGSQGGQQRTKITGADLRAGPSALVVVDGVIYMVDCGVGALLRISEAGFDANAIRHVFVTHHHQDHNAELGNVAGFSWTSGRQGAADRRLDIWGPPGTKEYLRGYKISTAPSIADQEGPLAQVPTFDDYAHPHNIKLKGRISKVGRRVMTDEFVRVSAIQVNHGEMPSLAYRIVTPDLTVVFSGDRGDRGDNLAQFATGADVMFHEISDLALVIPALMAQGLPDSFIEHQKHDHSGPQLVGETATAAGVPKLVLYHLIPGTTALPDAYWRALVMPYYGGEIVVGKDLLEVA